MATPSEERFGNDVEDMMFGFGDKWPPCADSVMMIEILVKDYIRDLARRAMHIASTTGQGLDKECFLYLVRTDQRKFLRIRRLLDAHQEIEDARKLKKTDESND